MTLDELDTRARQRAKEERLHTWKLTGQPVYMVRSRHTEPGSMHCVEVQDGRVMDCSCRGWQYRRSCTHAAAVMRRLEREGRSVNKRPAVTPIEPAPIVSGSRGRSQLYRGA
jgi:hypothetical protein